MLLKSMILSLCLATTTAHAEVITNDLGGSLNRYYREYKKFISSGEIVEIKGRCASACTIFIALPNACIHTDAKLGFHSATAFGLFQSKEGNEWVAKFYPPELRNRFLTKYSNSLGFTWLSGSDVLAMKPKAKPCPDDL